MRMIQTQADLSTAVWSTLRKCWDRKLTWNLLCRCVNRLILLNRKFRWSGKVLLGTYKDLVVQRQTRNLRLLMGRNRKRSVSYTTYRSCNHSRSLASSISWARNCLVVLVPLAFLHKARNWSKSNQYRHLLTRANMMSLSSPSKPILKNCIRLPKDADRHSQSTILWSSSLV